MSPNDVVYRSIFTAVKNSGIFIASFILLLVFYTVKDTFIYVVFEANRDFIAQELCENRDRPELHCDGNCVFMKAIKESHQKDKEFPALNLKGKFSFFVKQTIFSCDFELRSNVPSVSRFYLLKVYEPHIAALLKPPRIS